MGKRKPAGKSLEFGPTVDSGGSLRVKTDSGSSYRYGRSATSGYHSAKGSASSSGSSFRSVSDSRSSIGGLYTSDLASQRSGVIPQLSDSASSLKRVTDVEAQEHIADVLRLRAVLALALILWAATGVLDWSVVRFVEPGRLSYFLALRGTALLLMSLAVLRLYIQPMPSDRLFRFIDLWVFGVATLGASLLSIKYRGITSPYAHAVSCVLVVRGVALPSHYRRGIPGVLLPVAIYPCALVVAGQFLPEIHDQLHSPAHLAVFLQHVSLIAVTAAITVFGGHSMWSLRRQVFVARNIGRYRLQRLIGRGGMGEVWQAYHPALRRSVAIKLLRSHQLSGLALTRFEREVRATSELKHPNTIRVLDCGQTEDGLWYYAMELLEGETLSDLVEREGPLRPRRALHLIRQAARALTEAHQLGIIHRDIKPDNLYVTNLGGEPDFIKVLDFGIAKLVDDAMKDTGQITMEGSLLGTPAFMSPEQFMAQPIDVRTDVFSLGAVLFFMLTGKAPYDGNSLAEIRAAHFLEPKMPSEVAPQKVPPELDRVVKRCLDPSPSARYKDAGELAAVLATLRFADSFEEGELEPADPSELPPSAQPQGEGLPDSEPSVPTVTPVSAVSSVMSIMAGASDESGRGMSSQSSTGGSPKVNFSVSVSSTTALRVSALISDENTLPPVPPGTALDVSTSADTLPASQVSEADDPETPEAG